MLSKVGVISAYPAGCTYDRGIVNASAAGSGCTRRCAGVEYQRSDELALLGHRHLRGVSC